MLDVHPPHEAAHTWKDFFIHIATIVVGLIIAVGLEQTVEYFHHRHQLHRLEESLNEEFERNLQVIDHDVVIMNEIARVEEQNKAAINATIASNGKVPLVYTPTPVVAEDLSSSWNLPASAVLSVARDNGTLALLRTDRANFLARLDFSDATVIETAHQLFDAEYRVRAIVHLHPHLSDLSAEERSQLLLAVSDCEEEAMHSRLVLVRLRALIEHYK